jgi:hypothetical protein
MPGDFLEEVSRQKERPACLASPQSGQEVVSDDSFPTHLPGEALTALQETKNVVVVSWQTPRDFLCHEVTIRLLQAITNWLVNPKSIPWIPKRLVFRKAYIVCYDQVSGIASSLLALVSVCRRCEPDASADVGDNAQPPGAERFELGDAEWLVDGLPKFQVCA